MSFDSLESFEASLEAAKIRRRVPNINKHAFKKVLHHVKAHNRNQEEQEMWMRHRALKRPNSDKDISSDEEREKNRKRKKKREKGDRRKKKQKKLGKKIPKIENEDKNDEEIIGPHLADLLKPKVQKWGHDGFHKLYKDDSKSASSSESEEHIKVKQSKARSKRKKKKKLKKRKSSESSYSESSDAWIEKKAR